VTFESNGGTLCSPMEALVLEKLQMPVPERQGYDFAGWFTDSGLENPVAYPYTVTADITLYAKWVENSNIVITAQTAGSIDLSDITGEYTIKVTGSISQSTLHTLADKMKASKASFTLDLSDATRFTAIAATSDNTSIFADCPLRSVVLPKTLDAIGNYAFYGCSDLESVEIDGTETVGAYAFANCTNLQYISLKNTTTIGKYTFQNCTSLVSITVDTTTIGIGAFSDCTTLTSVVIGKNVKSLDNSNDGCFYKCNQLTSVRFEDTAKWYYKNSSSYSYSLNVTNAATNASNLKYYTYLWYKE
ncbi:MAG: leucine-rich repeat protein, partial [Treponema sp.]|nr:leucine-rich repeat protein [Treponema sp.]